MSNSERLILQDIFEGMNVREERERPKEYYKMVTPDMATTLLKGNIDNRRIYATHVDHLAKQMRVGRWRQTPVPILVTESGRLLDGQHRLLSCLKSGRTINFKFAVVADEDANDIFKILDQGKKRTLEDLSGKPAKVIKPLVYLLRSGTRVKSPTIEDIKPFLNSEAGTVLNEFAAHKSKFKLWRANHFLASMVVAVLNKDVTFEEVKENYRCLTQDDISAWPSIFTSLYVRLNEDRRHLGGANLENPVFLCGVYAWKHMKRDTKTIRITSGFVTQTKADVYAALYNICPEILN